MLWQGTDDIWTYSLDSLIVRVQDEQQEIQSVSQFLEEVFRVASVEQAKLDSFCTN